MARLIDPKTKTLKKALTLEMCDTLPLNAHQRKLCRGPHGLSLMHIIARASLATQRECKRQFQGRRWNCPNYETGPLFGASTLMTGELQNIWRIKCLVFFFFCWRFCCRSVLCPTTTFSILSWFVIARSPSAICSSVYPFRNLTWRLSFPSKSCLIRSSRSAISWSPSERGRLLRRRRSVAPSRPRAQFRMSLIAHRVAQHVIRGSRARSCIRGIPIFQHSRSESDHGLSSRQSHDRLRTRAQGRRQLTPSG